MNYSFTYPSKNSKLGPIAATRTEPSSCPTTCELKGKGCYAQKGPELWHWRKLNNGGLSVAELAAKLKTVPKGTLFRHNTAGDLDFAELPAIIHAARHLKAFAYTHHIGHNEEIKNAISGGFTINRSASSYDAALVSQNVGGIPAVFVAPVEMGKREDETLPAYMVRWKAAYPKATPCPQQFTDNLTCQACKLCANPNRPKVIGFVKH